MYTLVATNVVLHSLECTLFTSPHINIITSVQSRWNWPTWMQHVFASTKVLKPFCTIPKGFRCWIGVQCTNQECTLYIVSQFQCKLKLSPPDNLMLSPLGQSEVYAHNIGDRQNRITVWYRTWGWKVWPWLSSIANSICDLIIFSF